MGLFLHLETLTSKPDLHPSLPLPAEARQAILATLDTLEDESLELTSPPIFDDVLFRPRQRRKMGVFSSV